MAQINKPNLHFNTVLYTGNGSTQSISVGFRPDWVWFKSRDATNYHALMDIVRGETKWLYSNGTNAEGTYTAVDFTSTGYDLTHDANLNSVNSNSSTKIAWNWKAAGTAPTKTYTVKVVSDSGNKYRFDDFGTSAVTLELSEGGTYTFDQSDSSNSGHPLRFSTTSDGTHNSGTEYTTGVTTTGTPGSSGAKTVITVAASAPTLYYYCTNHSGMGGQANTPTTNSFSNFDGSIQSNVSPNTTAGFSIVSYTGNGTSGATIGHGLGTAPSWIVTKRRNTSEDWANYHSSLTADNYLYFTTAASTDDATKWNDTEPTSSVFSVGNHASVNGSSDTYIAYCFSEIKGYSKFGSYTGNGNADGTFIYTGFKPAFVIIKQTNAVDDWVSYDWKSNEYNQMEKTLRPHSSAAEISTNRSADFYSNGFKWRSSNGTMNESGASYIFMAFAEQPLVGTNNIPATAR